MVYLWVEEGLYPRKFNQNAHDYQIFGRLVIDVMMVLGVDDFLSDEIYLVNSFSFIKQLGCHIIMICV